MLNHNRWSIFGKPFHFSTFSSLNFSSFPIPQLLTPNSSFPTFVVRQGFQFKIQQWLPTGKARGTAEVSPSGTQPSARTPLFPRLSLGIATRRLSKFIIASPIAFRMFSSFLAFVGGLGFQFKIHNSKFIIASPIASLVFTQPGASLNPRTS